ncbi:hypothetical protein PoB_000820500 [Plakobranchus ocellatus]|uniref:Uncharacterized protein n=1 Tax=Plakobranchus ocellatus TaxID=259542 RepID=A0AAV3YGR8_9GAST|nr:hypothetical protein PoB_000820500 [Plakobranchus ocellatus]
MEKEGGAGAVDYHVRGLRFKSPTGPLLSCVDSVLNGWLGLLSLGEIKGDEESTSKVPQNGVCQDNQDSTPGSPMLGPSVRVALLTL